MSLSTRLAAVEAILGGSGGPGRGLEDITVYFDVFIWLGTNYWQPFENYHFFDWSVASDPPPELHAYGSHMDASYLDAHVAQGYTVMLLFDPSHTFDENSLPPVWPAYGPEHIIPWAGYTPGDCLARVLNKRPLPR